MAAMIAQPGCLQPFATVAGGSTGRSVRLIVRAQTPKAEGLRAAVRAVRNAELPAHLKPAALLALANAVAALPAHADAGKIFDFNLTLPIMTGQFLLLMVFLDKFWFTPVGKVLDERDGYIREQLQKFKSNDGEILDKQKEAERVLAEARVAAQKEIQEAKSAAQDKQSKRLGEVKAKIDKELASALAALDKEKEAALSDLDAQVDKLSGEILARVLPEGVKL